MVYISAMTRERRYDLDWLRVIVFALLIFYHVGMFFVPWGYHVKNNVIYDWIRWPMLFLNQWRLPILFVISGMGTAFALAFRTGGQFIGERGRRLGIPLLFGMLVIIPPQVYVERVSDGEFLGSYFDFLLGPAFQGIYPSGNLSWHHLWFLPYLLVFSILLSPMFLAIRRNPDHSWLKSIRASFTKSPGKIYFLIIPLYLCEALLEPFFPVTHNLFWDWFNFFSSLILFFYGFLLISLGEVFWLVVDKLKYRTLFLGVLAFSLQAVIWIFFEDSVLIHFLEAFLKVFNLWSWILAIFGFAATHLNSPSPRLAYCNRAVYPYYILHQTITLVIGFYIKDLDWSFATKFWLLVVGTFLGSGLIYEFIIRRIRLLHPFFGLK